MKKNKNKPEPAPAPLEHVLQGHLASTTLQPSPEFLGRCRTAALSALDVLKMQRQRAVLAHSPGTLVEHFEALAGRAGVSLEGTFQTLGITRADAPDAAGARGLAQLARYLGLLRDEAVLRLRYGFAKTAGLLPTDWPGASLRVRARGQAETARDGRRLEEALREGEATYQPDGRKALLEAVNSLVRVYEQDF